jgi:4-hydroxybenzoate polyprenyltransferase
MAGWVKTADLFFAARPMLHIPVWSIYLVSLHYHHQFSGGKFDWTNLLMVVCLSSIAAGSYWWNQVYDYDSDLANRKLGFLQQKLLTRQELTAAFIISSILALAVSPFFSVLIFAIFTQAFILSFAYSAPPFRLKDRVWWGYFANAWGIGFMVPFCVMPELTVHNAGLLGWDNPSYFFLAVGSIYALTTIPDRTGDKIAGKRTIAVILGAQGARTLAFAITILSAVVAYRSEFWPLMILSLVSAALMAAATAVRSDRLTLAAAKAPILLLTLQAGFFYPLYLLFIIVLIAVTRVYYSRRFNMTYPRIN